MEEGCRKTKKEKEHQVLHIYQNLIIIQHTSWAQLGGLSSGSRSELIFSTYFFPKTLGSDGAAFVINFQVFSLVPTVLSWARHPHKAQSDEATLTSECQTNPQPATFHSWWAENLSCNIAEVVLCATTQTPGFTSQDLRDRQPPCYSFAFSTITVTFLWQNRQHSNQIAFNLWCPLCDQRK